MLISQVAGGNGTPLWWAALQGHKDVVELLIQKGANIYGDPNCEQEAYKNRHFFEKSTPLWLAAFQGYIDIMELLVINGANPEIGLEGLPPITAASAEGQHQAVELLLQMGVDVNTQDDEGVTALDLSIMMGNKATVDLLIKKGADLERRSPGEQHFYGGHDDIAEILISNGADIEASDCFGQTPLWEACHYRRTGLVEILLRSGANTEVRDWQGRTPLMIAVKEGHTDVVKILT
ncbi:cyclin dependent kinase (Pho85) [Apiospora rasikravindrae]|uniref:Cyclin dependent kinase (Pho85) n=1 Tax=Apiospora rasikravindrae TaxID=990691 RepID=A0ABR1RQY2_9PEZI